MVELKTIPDGQLGSLIHRAFFGDLMLINRFHLVNGSLGDCVKSTFYQIDKCARRGDKLNYYGVYYNGAPIGFTVTGENYLLSFGLDIQYRSKAIVLDWWAKVCDLLKKEFVTWLFKKNTRAIAFCERNGMRVIEEHPDYVTLLYEDLS